MIAKCRQGLRIFQRILSRENRPRRRAFQFTAPRGRILDFAKTGRFPKRLNLPIGRCDTPPLRRPHASFVSGFQPRYCTTMNFSHPVLHVSHNTLSPRALAPQIAAADGVSVQARSVGRRDRDQTRAKGVRAWHALSRASLFAAFFTLAPHANAGADAIPAAGTPAVSVALGALMATGDGAPAAQPDEITRLAPVVVTAPTTGETPLSVRLDTSAAARPGPAQDGADILRAFPGIVVSRKGGTGGEVLLRGAGGSRTGILLDHESLLGGCPNRMDPPSAYIFPGEFDSVTVVKGLSAVRHGPGNSAGVVLFKSATPVFEAPGVRADFAAGFGSAGRNDQNLAVAAGIPLFYVQADASRTAADDYRDGAGELVHSRYRRLGGRLAAGWTPDRNTVLEFHGSAAEGRAAYAHSSMDAAALDRRGAGLRFEKRQIGGLLQNVEAGLFYNTADHVMDNFTLRQAPAAGMMAGGMAGNVSQTVWGGRALATFAIAQETTCFTPGVDFTFSTHDSRSGTPTESYKDNPRERDASLGTAGVFVEASHAFGAGSRLHGGARLNTWRAKDLRAPLSHGGGMGGEMGGGMGMEGHGPVSGVATGGHSRDGLLPALFVRYEHDLAALPGLTLYANAGHTWRAPDYWELFSYQGPHDNSAFETRPEKTTQLDIGGEWKRGAFALRVSLFANESQDYILVEHATDALGTRNVSRNVAARAVGGELGAGHTVNALGGQWQFDGSLAFVHGWNRTDDRPLAQLPPLEGRIGVGYVWGDWSFGVTTRLVAAQHRHAVGQGGITGLDLGPTTAFAVAGLNVGYCPRDWVELSAGIDNLFDAAYAEHVNRAGSGYPGYVSNVRVLEPGRTFWARIRLRY